VLTFPARLPCHRHAREALLEADGIGEHTLDICDVGNAARPERIAVEIESDDRVEIPTFAMAERLVKQILVGEMGPRAESGLNEFDVISESTQPGGEGRDPDVTSTPAVDALWNRGNEPQPPGGMTGVGLPGLFWRTI